MGHRRRCGVELRGAGAVMELSDDEFNSLDEHDVRELVADESRWMRNGGIDAISWPKPLTVRPVAVRTPYPWCRQKDVCTGKGSCPLDPTCGD
jgi:hypothetical protein